MTHLPITRNENAASSAGLVSDETALIARVAGRDQDAFEHLYRAYHPRLRHFLLRMTRRPALVEEVLNETMLVVWRRASTYNHASKVSTWIFAIAYRQSLKAMRRVDTVVDEDMDKQRFPGHGPDGELQRHQLSEHLHKAMAALSAEHRVVIDLIYYHGYACREVAAIMHCPVDTVKTRMFYARRRLKTLLAMSREDVS